MILNKIPDNISNEFDDDSLIYLSDDSFYYGKNISKNLIKDIKNHTVQLYNGFYEFHTGYDSPKLYYTGRGKNSGKVKVKIQNFHPYFYEQNKDGKYKSILGKSVEKMVLIGQHPRNVKRYREHCRKMKEPIPYESDIRFPIRFLIDTYDYFKPTEAIPPKVCILDIETNHPISDDIISFAINDMENNIYYRSKYDDMYPTELALDIYHKLQEYDVVTGWNVTWDIDLLYCRIRKTPAVLNKIDRHLDYARKHYEFDKEKYIKMMSKGNRYFSDEETKNLIELLIKYDYLRLDTDGVVVLGDNEFNPRIHEHIAIVDMLGRTKEDSIIKKMHAKEIRGRWTLDNTGIQLAGIGKVHTGATRIGDLPPEKLMEYNVIDTIIPEILDNDKGGLEAHTMLAWSLHMPIKDVVITAVVSDVALLREYHKDGVVLPSRSYAADKKEKKEAQYKAAEPDARSGVYKNIVETDIVHAYPSAVISNNISIETQDPNGRHHTPSTPFNPNGVRYNDDDSTFIRTLKSLMVERVSTKKKLNSYKKYSAKWKYWKSIDFAVKTEIAALSHGLFGWPNSRVKNYPVADSITAVVRFIIDTIKDVCDEIGHPWIYLHTDSAFFCADEDEAKQIVEKLNNTLKEHCKDYKEIPVLEYKGTHPVGYIHSPARRVIVPKGVDINNDDGWIVKGMSYMRSETPIPLGNIEVELIKLKMKGASKVDLILKLKSMILDLPSKNTIDLALVKPLNKPLEEYGGVRPDGSHIGTPNHITAYKLAHKEYGLEVPLKSKFGIIPILTDEITGIRKVRRKRVDMAYSLDTGLPKNYKVDWEYYLNSNLYGKIWKLFNMAAKDLEKYVMTPKVKGMLNVPIVKEKEK